MIEDLPINVFKNFKNFKVKDIQTYGLVFGRLVLFFVEENSIIEEINISLIKELKNI